jgi:uncharacterized protein (TIGR03083 family)
MDFLAPIRRDSDRFYTAADTADPATRVAACPEWNVGDLVWHLAEVQWFWGTIVEIKATDPDAAEKLKPPRPDEYRDLIAFGRDQTDRMIGLLEQNDDATPVWTWALDESDHTVGFIRRHQVQEAAVHRWDIQHAATPGHEDPIEPEVASDSLDELLDITMPWSINEKKPLPGTVHVHCTDTEGEWFISSNGRVERVHQKGDVALRAPAADLLLSIYKRVPIDVVEFIGDDALGRQFVSRIDGS